VSFGLWPTFSMCSSQSDCESRARERATREADGRRFPASPRDPGGARALHLPVSTGEASLIWMSPRRCPWPRDRASAHSPEGCIENSAVVHMNVCSGLGQKRPSAPYPFGNSEACSVAFRLHPRTRCRQSSEGTARVERTGRAADGERQRVVEGLEGAIGSRCCARCGKLDTGCSA
jgi:hypothetical protein